jgi:hypothetical protein
MAERHSLRAPLLRVWLLFSLTKASFLFDEIELVSTNQRRHFYIYRLNRISKGVVSTQCTTQDSASYAVLFADE